MRFERHLLAYGIAILVGVLFGALGGIASAAPTDVARARAAAARRRIDTRTTPTVIDQPAPATEPGAPPRRAPPPTEEELFGCAKVPAGKRFKWSVRGEVGITELVASLGELSCQAIIVGPGVTGRAGKVALEVPDLLTAGEVHRIFLSSLETLGLTVERSGGLWKVVDAGRAKEVSAPLSSTDATPTGEVWVTRLIRLRHARVSELSDIVGRLKSKDGDVSPFAAGNALVVTDRGQVVRRMEELVAQLDIPRGTVDKLFVVATHRQSATELATTLEKLLLATRRTEGGDGAAAVGAKAPAPSSSASTPGPLAEGISALVPLDATRSIVVAGTEAGWRRVVGLLERLDPPLAAGEEPGGHAHVLYLAHTNAEDIAQTLSQLGLGAVSSGGAARGGTGTFGGGPPTATMGSRSSSGSAAASLSLSGDVRIAPDKMANALVVIAGNADFHIVRDLITRLDVPRRQVFVQATILDVTVDKSREVGVTWHNGSALPGGATAFGSNSTSSSTSLITTATQLAALVGSGGALAGVLGPSMNIAGQSVPSFGVVLHALERAKNVHVISRPHLLTMDNVKSTLSVGQTFPVQTGTVGTAGAGNSLLTSFGRQEVALKIDLVPHLNDSDSVRLEIVGEISDVPDGQASSQAGGPVTNKRTITTAVVVKDGEAVVLGGLQKESDAETVDKIPVLGDIPILGHLFRSKGKQRVQQDLLIVLQPYVIRGPEDLRRILEQRDAERREFLERFTAFRDEIAFDTKVDYKRKRGLLEEIHVTARRAEEEAAAIARAKRMLRPAEGPLEEGAMAEPAPKPRAAL